MATSKAPATLHRRPAGICKHLLRANGEGVPAAIAQSIFGQTVRANRKGVWAAITGPIWGQTFSSGREGVGYGRREGFGRRRPA